MTRDSEEYKQFCAKYEAEEKEREDNPDKYPYFAYYQFGFHRMTYITEEELKEAIAFYHLKSDCKGGYFRYGRQPITILPRKGEREMTISIILFIIAIYLAGFSMGFVTRDLIHKLKERKEN